MEQPPNHSQFGLVATWYRDLQKLDWTMEADGCVTIDENHVAGLNKEPSDKWAQLVLILRSGSM